MWYNTLLRDALREYFPNRGKFRVARRRSCCEDIAVLVLAASRFRYFSNPNSPHVSVKAGEWAAGHNTFCLHATTGEVLCRPKVFLKNNFSNKDTPFENFSK